MNRIRALIVDDSASMRRLLGELLESDSEITVVGTAEDPYIAREKIKRFNPDVITLDVEMPRMDGITFLGNLMRLRPLPVVMVSSRTLWGAEATLRALELGAVDFVAKPELGPGEDLAPYRAELLRKVRGAACARLQQQPAVEEVPPLAVGPNGGDRVIAIGASTGGVEAIRRVLTALPPNAPPVLMAQHMPPEFSGAFAARLRSQCGLDVVEARSGERLEAGRGYLAPGDGHLALASEGGYWISQVRRGERVDGLRPCIDILFRSLARVAGSAAIGVLLTGMGKDGAQGLLEMRSQGGATIAQDDQTSVVWGMPRAAVEIGAAEHVEPLGRIPLRIVECLRSARR